MNSEIIMSVCMAIGGIAFVKVQDRARIVWSYNSHLLLRSFLKMVLILQIQGEGYIKK